MQDASIGAWLKRRRAELALTQQQLGQRVGASVITIRKLEANARKPSAEMARALLQSLAIPENERAAFLTLAAAAVDERNEPATSHWPRHFTSLVGRESELGRATTLLLRDEVRLLTVLGPGGIGKTRFGLAVAEQAEVAAHFADGVFFVDLAPVREAAQVLDTICQTLATPRAPTLAAGDALRRALKDKHALLVLDNFEQVTGAAREVGELLLDCPRLKIIATSRSVLRIGLEKRFILEPLTLPSAIELFAQRAQAADERFGLDTANAEAVQQMCQLLEGLPLAIELVAARVSLMSPRTLLSRLKNREGKVRLELVADGLSELPARQKTLQRTLQWSYDLLSADEQAAFRRLSVFAGGFSLGSAESLLQAEQPDPIAIWNTLTSLSEKSLIQKRDSERSTERNDARDVERDDAQDSRMVLLETVRLFASEKLAQRDEARTYRARHLNIFLSLAESAAPHWRGPQQKEWANVVRLEQPDLHAALEFALAIADVSASIRFCSALWRFWLLRGQLHVGRGFCARALSLARQKKDDEVDDVDVAAARANCLRGFGLMCERQGDYAEAETCWRESLRIYQALNDRVNEAAMHSTLGIIAIDQRDFVQAQLIFSEAVAFCQREGLTSGLASAYSNLGFVAKSQEEYAAAITHFSEAIRLWRQLESKTDLAWCLCQLGTSQAQVGDSMTAHASFMECLSLCQEPDDVLNILSALEGLALIAAKHGQAELAVKVYAASNQHSTQLGTQESPANSLGPQGWERMLETLRSTLGEQAFAESWQQGQALSLDEAIALAASLQMRGGTSQDAPT